jgi:hypothetical protein
MSLFVGEDSQLSEPRFRLADYLRRHYQRERFASARFGKDIGATNKTAENIFDGHWPTSRHFQRIVALFGEDVLDAVFRPDIDATVARLKREEGELEQLLAEKRAKRQQAEGVGARDLQRAEAPSARVVPLKERRSFAAGGRP